MKRILTTLALAIVCAFYVPIEDHSPINPADDYCSISYPSPYDGSPQYPIGCPQP